eukprot:maker-scaffold_8-snap-gene-9.22-mRNA-1 protein AED:0.04 eAED:0.04 QI:154/0.5/0.66/1/1/1/3/69/237
MDDKMSSTTRFVNNTQGNARKSKYRESLASMKKNQTNLFSVVLVPMDDNESHTIPDQDETNDWVAENLLDFGVNHLYYHLTSDEWKEAIRNSTLPNRGYPEGIKYTWKIRSEYVTLDVDQYCEEVLHWCERMFGNDNYFPLHEETPYRHDFLGNVCEKMFKRLFRVFAIIFSNPLLHGFKEDIERNQQQKHLEQMFNHFMYFAWFWGLLPTSEEKCIEDVLRPIRENYTQDKKEYES